MSPRVKRPIGKNCIRPVKRFPCRVHYAVQSGEITDAHSIVPGTPVTDECTQDWTLLSADVGDGSLVFEVQRALDTDDAQDRVFVDDTRDGDL